MAPGTTREVVERLGGVFAVAEALGVTRQAVYNWHAWNVFPPHLYLEMLPLARAAGIELDPSLFRSRGPRAMPENADVR